MKRLALITLVGLTACGGLENEPFKTGVVRGQLTGTDDKALVSVVGRDDLATRPDATGAFELAGVPLGQAELLIIVNATHSRRLTVEVGGAAIVQLGVVEPRPSMKVEVHVVSPGLHWLGNGTVTMVGLPVSAPIEVEGLESEAEFRLPAGCYEARAAVPGLGEATKSFCVTESVPASTRVTMPEPDGSPGREGCSVTGCPLLLTCQANRSCG